MCVSVDVCECVAERACECVHVPEGEGGGGERGVLSS